MFFFFQITLDELLNYWITFFNNFQLYENSSKAVKTVGEIFNFWYVFLFYNNLIFWNLYKL